MKQATLFFFEGKSPTLVIRDYRDVFTSPLNDIFITAELLKHLKYWGKVWQNLGT